MELKNRKTFFILVGTILFALLISLKILPFANSFPLIKPEKIFSELSLNKNRKAKKVEETEFSSEKSFQVSERNISQASMKIQAKKAQPDSKPITLLSSTIRRGDTIYRLLRKAGVSPQKSYFLLKSLKKVFTPRDCKPGDRIKLLKSTEDGRIIFKYFPGGLNYYLVEEIQPNKFSVSVQKLVAEKILVGAKGKVYSSLYEAMRKEGIDTELILNFADIFSWEIDFLTDPRKGDSFKMIWERYIDPEGKILKEGKILAAQYINKGKEYTAIFYSDPEGHRGYFTPEGKSLRRSFLRSPLNYRRISSYFSYRRFHPILKVYRPHLGIDYAAPTGTPVSSIGDGEVIFAGWKGGFGKFVKIRHPNGYITSYGHLSRIARGIRRGKKVSQGQVIGYVGSTGLATGPHLDFRISKNGRYLNFLKLDFPRTTPVKSAYRNEFQEITRTCLYYLQVLSEASQNIFVFSENLFKDELT